jgi:Pyruvate/2-oxoacid:ferredoxin oxidoreductase delta subunit
MKTEERILESPNKHKDFVVSGSLVSIRDRPNKPVAAQAEATPIAEGRVLTAGEILTIEEVAAKSIDGLDTAKVLSAMGDIGPEARLFLHRPNGKLARHEIFADPRVCVDIHRGAVVENLNEKPKDVSGWRTHEFFIDTKGCLGDECGRCAIVCPESAIHLRGKGKGSFHEIDPLACKGCYICWVECVRTAADCILVDGKTFDPGMRAKHFGD